MKKNLALVVLAALLTTHLSGLAAEADFEFEGRPFHWVNPMPGNLELPPNVHHRTFVSTSMQREVGYGIYLPPDYDESVGTRYPVVYYLHGGRPGNEMRSIGLTIPIHEYISSEKAPPAIYIFVNGGVISHYDYFSYDSMGEKLFIDELIPHIDGSYRTIAAREGRALQGFSQGGRGTTRIMFKYPELFSSAAAGGPGYATEKLINENDGVEYDTRRPNPTRYDFGEGNDAYSLAELYASSDGPKLEIAIWIGSAGFNYSATLEYMQFLDSLDIDYKSYIVGKVGHNPLQLYESIGIELMNFHADSFGVDVE